MKSEKSDSLQTVLNSDLTPKSSGYYLENSYSHFKDQEIQYIEIKPAKAAIQISDASAQNIRD